MLACHFEGLLIYTIVTFKGFNRMYYCGANDGFWRHIASSLESFDYLDLFCNILLQKSIA